eukprot:scaffold97352_cov45-Attheya_sp.AAC.1
MSKIAKLPRRSIGRHKLSSATNCVSKDAYQPIRSDRRVACTAVHGAKKYENTDINGKNKKSCLPCDTYPRVPFESLQVSAGTGEVPGAGGAQRVWSVLSKSHSQNVHRTKQK